MICTAFIRAAFFKSLLCRHCCIILCNNGETSHLPVDKGLDFDKGLQFVLTLFSTSNILQNYQKHTQIARLRLVIGGYGWQGCSWLWWVGHPTDDPPEVCYLGKVYGKNVRYKSVICISLDMYKQDIGIIKCSVVHLVVHSLIVWGVAGSSPGGSRREKFLSPFSHGWLCCSINVGCVARLETSLMWNPITKGK